MSDNNPSRMTYWLTRDQDIDGRLNDHIDVWLSQPEFRRVTTSGGIIWYCAVDEVTTGEGECPARYAQWTVAQCLKACYVYPETERECIRVGE